jgi:phospholipid-transporting ATPase
LCKYLILNLTSSVGDIVKVQQNEAFPADLICIVSSEAGGLCYIETSQLDGETNLKIRRSLPATSKKQSVDLLDLLKSTITYEQPNNQLYKFVGTFQMDDDEKVIPIEVEQTLLRGALLKNTAHIFGVVVYTGKHTKLMMNSEDAPHKRSKVENVTNYAIIGLFILEILVTLLCSFGIGIWQTVNRGSWYLAFDMPSAILSLQGLITFFILFNNFIPIRLVICINLALNHI